MKTLPEQYLATVAAIGATGLLVGCGSGFLLAFFPLLMRGQGAGDVLIGAATSLQMSAVLAVVFFLTSRIARHGLYAVYGTALACALLSLAALSLTHSLPVTLALRFLLGMGVSTLFVVVETWVNTVAVPHLRSRTVTVYTMAMAAGMGIGPALLTETGTEGGLPYLTAGVLYALSFLPVRAMRRSALPHRSVDAPHPLRFVRTAPGIMLLIALFGVIESAVFTFLPLYGMAKGIAQRDAILMVATVLWAGFLLQIPVGTLADLTDRRRTLIGTCLAVALGAYWLGVPVASDVWRWPALALWGGALTSIYMLGQSLLGERLSTAELPAGTMAMVTLYGMGSVVGPSVLGVAMQEIGPRGFELGVALAAALGALAAWRVKPRKSMEVP